MTSQITGLRIVCSIVCSGANQRIHQSFASLAFVISGFPSQRASNADNVPFDDVITMMTSRHQHAFRITGPFWWEFSGHLWNQRTSNAELSCSFVVRETRLLNKQSRRMWFETHLMPKWHHSNMIHSCSYWLINVFVSWLKHSENWLIPRKYVVYISQFENNYDKTMSDKGKTWIRIS